MPTPIPIIAATWPVKSGVVTNADQIVTPVRETRMPQIAVAIGSPIAMTEPNASSRITTAASRPMNSVAGSSPSVNISPPKATSIDDRSASSCISTATSSRNGGPVEVNSIDANATVPSSDTRDGSSSGESIDATARHRCELGEHLTHLGLARGRTQSCVGVEDNRGRLLVLLRQVLGDQVVGDLGVGAVEAVLSHVLRTEAAGERHQRDGADHPEQQGPSTVAGTGCCETFDHAFDDEGSWSPNPSRPLVSSGWG